ncbi:MAG: dihydroorotate dehydrogenase electron transfer subunit [Pirellulales bacterium]|nr:dihydroorotate dehydrogenase electron transfer subunit [Pirellulales bacterium]
MAAALRVRIVENIRLARETYRVRFECPEIARFIVPGQFLMLRLAGLNDPLLGRPLALYDTVLDSSGSPCAIDVVYLTLGKMTRRLARCRPGDELEVWGPLGNGFPGVAAEHLIMVAGGIGQTPFLALGQEYLGMRRYGSPPRTVPRGNHATLCYGVRSADLLAGVEHFRSAGFDVRLSSDDGSAGHPGLVTDTLQQVLGESGVINRLVVSCGPEPMLKAVSGLCEHMGVPCLVSLETPMACGVGICFSCVARVRQPNGGWDYKRTCVEGPVFRSQEIEW